MRKAIIINNEDFKIEGDILLGVSSIALFCIICIGTCIGLNLSFSSMFIFTLIFITMGGFHMVWTHVWLLGCCNSIK